MEKTKLLKYTFNISKIKGYKGKTMWIYFSTFKNIEYEGFRIKESKKYSVIFEVDIKLIRRLKILNLNKDKKVRNGTIENKILYFIYKSNEITLEEYEDNKYSYSWYSAPYRRTSYYDEEFEIEKNEQKKFQKISSKIYTQKGKQYESKARFCK